MAEEEVARLGVAWTCARCTYENALEAEKDACGACETARPRPTSTWPEKGDRVLSLVTFTRENNGEVTVAPPPPPPPPSIGPHESWQRAACRPALSLATL
eukprot:SAG11_NODE_11860_length_734_cov_1.481890_1_plen_100_part_00